ncbi:MULTISPECIES: TetR/AcrR family transcriptional regulator [unclassified Streptomyces]|uniref:TetR/AcrR family transcriptional regulator n=1 Tax=unclassified Streptomyces TaxID=2593676 RepID=UPI002E15F6F2|nr:TetR/AcrR family transcriptional regulator [Streptomyces sp. NBC_01324]
MPTARDALLDAARAALTTRPWPAVRMVEVAAAAGVSRQTLHNEFGGKDGLARALVRRAADGYLAGVEQALGTAGGTGDRLAATAAWTARATRTDDLVRGLLTGCWEGRLPGPAPSVHRARPPGSPRPARWPADAGPPTPAELLDQVRDRVVAALDGGGSPPGEPAALAATCELVLRLALSYALVPPSPGTPGDGVPLVRDVVERAAGAAAGSGRGAPGAEAT